MKKISYSLVSILMLVSSQLMAQSSVSDFYRNIGKIYVVVAVIVAIFVGIVIFLIYLEKKLTNLENQIQNNE